MHTDKHRFKTQSQHKSFRFPAVANRMFSFSNLDFAWIRFEGRLRHIYTATETDRAPRACLPLRRELA